MTRLHPDKLQHEQRDICIQYGCQCDPPHLDSKLGFAFDTKDALPRNGLRHPPTADTNGWYLWGGEFLPAGDDAFSPLHTKHLLDYWPEIVRFLGLPPGYRFLVAGEYVDVWYDATLIDFL